MAYRPSSRRNLASTGSRSRRSAWKQARPNPAETRPSLLEPLEARLLLSTYSVTTIDDAGLGSLRQAIMDANANANTDAGPDEIDFGIDIGIGGHIQLLSALPAITDQVNLDATTQDGYAGTPLVWLDGSQLGFSDPAYGLTIDAGGSTVRGLAITGFSVSGILVQSAGNFVLGNFVGVDPSGTAGAANGANGIEVNGSTAPAGATIQGNVISANWADGILFAGDFTACAVLSNRIGVDVSGSLALGNSGNGITVGPSDAGLSGVTIRGNVISGNYGDGVRLDGAVNAVVAGNVIGTNAAGTSSVDDYGGLLSNFANGVMIQGSAANNTIGGADAGERNLISGNFGDGVRVDGGTGNIIQGNFVGTNLDGTAAVSNYANGVELLASGNAVTDNVLSGNIGDGVRIVADDNIVQGNQVGTQADGPAAVANGADGIWVDASGNLIGGGQAGQGNRIAFNVGNGVTINSGTGNAVRGNSIYSNASGDPSAPGIGIDLGYNGVTLNDSLSHDGPNLYQNFPTLTGATRVGSTVTVTGTLAAAPSQTFTIELFSNQAADSSGYGQGQTYVGSVEVTTNAAGSASFTCSLGSVPAGQQFLTATATDAAGNTSEFSFVLNITNPISTVATTTTTLSSSVNPSLFAQSVTFTAVVINTSGSDVPPGSVTFTDGSTLLGTVLLDSTGQATLTTPNLAVGSHTIVATYIGDSAFASSSSAPLTQIVNPLLSTLGGSVFVDLDGDGRVDADEPVIAGVDVSLAGSDDLGQPVGLTTQTGVTGAYVFAGLRPGTYSITETQPAGYLQGKAFAGTLGGTVSSDTIASIVVEQNRHGAGYNFTEVQPGSISGKVFLDSNDNNAFDTGEAGIGVVTVTLTGTDDLGSVTLVAQTDASGLYAFPNLRPGVYAVAETQPAGYLDAAGAGNAYSGIGLPGGRAVADVNFAEIQPGSLAGRVYLDANDNNTFDSGETGIAAVNVTLAGTDDLGHAVNTVAQTNGSGLYAFVDLRPGTYSVVETQPAGYLDAAGSGNAYSGIAVSSGSAVANKNFAEIQPGSLAGRVYLDANDNNAFDSGETGIAGVTMTLTGTDDLGHAVNTVAQTNGSGLYAFVDLRPGTYSIVETQPAGYLDAAGSGNAYSGIAVSSGSAVANKNFADILPGSLAGYVYLDANNNGVRDPAEAGISAVTVTLTGTNDLGQAISTTARSGINGDYLFAALRPGRYRITETQPSGYQDGLEAVGSLGGVAGNDVIDAIALAGGSAGTGYNFGERAPLPTPGALSGHGLRDTTGNGLSGDDTPLGGVTVNLYLDRNNDGNLNDGAAVATMTTSAATGAYSFTGLTPGRYFVQEVVPCGFVETAPALSTYYSVQVADGVNAGNLDFDNYLKPDTSRVTGVSFLINSTTTVSDLRGKTKEGDLVQVVFTITDGVPVQLSLVSYTAPDSTFVAGHASQQEMFDLDTGTFGPGTYTMSVTDPDSYYQVDFVVGAAIDQLGPANSNIFYSAQGRLISADNEGVDRLITGGSMICGTIYSDANFSGAMEVGEVGLGNVNVTLTGTDNQGHAVRIVMLTDLDGQYKFSNLRPGTYAVAESQPVDFTDGEQTVGSAGGTVVANPAAGTSAIAGIILGQDLEANGNNFGELAVNLGPAVQHGQAATVLFWKSSLGQTLIKSFNGSSNSTSLGNWLATNFPKLYGSQAGTHNLAGKTDTQVASMFTTLYNLGGMRLDAQVMGLALSVYATNSKLAGTAAVKYGFLVDASGAGAATYNVGDSGAAFDVATNTTMRIMDILKETNGDAVNGTLYNSSAALCALANLVYVGINTIGGVS